MITLQAATKSDATAMMNLRNGENTHIWFYSNRKFALEEVEKWIENLDQNKDMVFMVYENNQIIGTCSLYNIEGAKAEVGRIVVDESIRGKGIGTSILQQITQIAITKELEMLYANIKADNVSSYKAFEKAGYERTEKRPGTGYYYELRLI